jgi:exopolyphosphatase/guanosine-5'-triphosphate,3'-diphosphate pyrophosphatase
MVDPGRSLVGVAGTTTTVQAIAMRLERYDPEAIHGSKLSRRDAERVAEDLGGMTVAERAALPVMPPGREDVIVAGAQILLEILDRWGTEGCVVSERDILDGLALEMLRAKP